MSKDAQEVFRLFLSFRCIRTLQKIGRLCSILMRNSTVVMGGNSGTNYDEEFATILDSDKQ
jgi:hypothetical protein